MGLPPNLMTGRLVIIEDNTADTQYIISLLDSLSGENDTLKVTTAGTLREALPVLAAQEIGLILLDLSLPDAQGTDCLDTVVHAAAAVPVVVLMASDNEERRATLLVHGAQDCLTKHTLTHESLLKALVSATALKAVEMALREQVQQTELLCSQLRARAVKDTTPPDESLAPGKQPAAENTAESEFHKFTHPAIRALLLQLRRLTEEAHRLLQGMD